MAPRTVNYTQGSIIYFDGDRADSVYLLKSGKVQLKSINTDDLSEVIEIVKTGEFFGVKSGLIKFPREERAISTANSVVIQFPTSDFEALINKNISIIMKMLKVFSNQLRRIHKKIEDFVGERNADNPVYKFFLLGDFYLKEKRYDAAITTFTRFIKYHKDYSEVVNLAKERLLIAENAKNKYGNNGGPMPDIVQPDEGIFLFISTPNISIINDEGIDKKIIKSTNLINEKNYLEAYNFLKELLSSKEATEDYKKDIQIKIITCMFYLGKYKDAIQNCLEYLKLYQNTDKKSKIFYYMGASYYKLGDNYKAKDAYKIALSLTDKTDPSYDSIQNAIEIIAE